MRLGEIILENERKKQGAKNAALVKHKLRDLVYTYPKEVTRAMIATGAKVQKNLPAQVVHALLIKQVAKNSELREAVSRMILEMDDYVSANGETWGLIGGALSAVGSVLSGLGRSQASSPDDKTLLMQQQQMEQQLEQERAKRRRTTWVVIGISAVVILGLFLAYRASKKKVVESAVTPQVAMS